MFNEAKTKPDPNEPQIKTLKTLCPHCSNITYQNFTTGIGHYRVYRCNICGEITLQEVHNVEVESVTRRGKRITEIKEELDQLWPPPASLPNEVPERVRKIYEEAISIKSKSPSSFVVQIRRALEAVANERKVPSSSLYNQIEWMIKNGLLPDTFGKMIQITRILGNLGAHDAEKDVELKDTEVVDEFFRAAVEYIYIAPAKVERVAGLMKVDART